MNLTFFRLTSSCFIACLRTLLSTSAYIVPTKHEAEVISKTMKKQNKTKRRNQSAYGRHVKLEIVENNITYSLSQVQPVMNLFAK